MPNVAKEPVLIGVYDAALRLCRKDALTLPMSDALVPKFMELREEFDTVYFLRGPGSFMSLKLLYLFAKTLEIAKGVKLFAAHAFHFNENSPIKAYGNCYFVCKDLNNASENGGICVERFSKIPPIRPFVVPPVLDTSIFDSNIKPLYLLPPV